MNYEKFKAEVQEEFHGDWQFSDESSVFSHVGHRGAEWNRSKRFSARRGTLSISWRVVSCADFPVAMSFSLARPSGDVPVIESGFKSVSAVKLFLLDVESAIGLFVRDPGEASELRKV